MSDLEEEGVAPSMPDMDAEPVGSVGKKGKWVKEKKITDTDWSGLIRLGYGMLFFGLLMVLLMGMDHDPDSDDYDNFEDYYDAVESHQNRQQVYPALFVFAFFGGVILISGGLVSHGIDKKKEMHHYVRIAVIISGVFILSLFISGFFDLLLTVSIFS